MLLQLAMAGFGIYALVTGRINMFRKRRLSEQMTRGVGLIMVLGAGAPLLLGELGVILFWAAVIAAFAIGYFMAEPVETA